jgi:phosphonopyruvate decarboxylase
VSAAAVPAGVVLDLLGATDHTAYLGVPCSLLAPLYDGLSARGVPVHAAPREDIAIGVASGLALAGRRAAVLMQNSGLASSVAALLSLPRMYGLGMTLLVSWRGRGPDAPEHRDLGREMNRLLGLARLRWAAVSAPRHELLSLMKANEPVAILVSEGDVC